MRLPKRPGILMLLLCLLTGTIAAQQNSDSCRVQISLLTCSPGQELYSIFGHSAFRVVDNVNGRDIIFNYGTFDFDDPEFYSKFVRGKLLYFVSAADYTNFRYSYAEENRSIIEQPLNLSCEAKDRLYQALIVNLQEDNKFYLYDFLFDNCSTRLRDMLVKNSDTGITFRRIIPTIDPPTFRHMIHEYLEEGNQYWSKLGIDMLLGKKLDRPVVNSEAMFLPDYLMKGFDSAFIGTNPVVGSKRTVLEASPVETGQTIFRPFVVTLIVLVLFGGLYFVPWKGKHKILSVFDSIFFLLIGLLGCLILYMWYGTDHVFCRDNFNLIWALPTHVIVVWFINKNKNWVKTYFTISALWYFLLFFAWALLPQDMNSAFIPVVVLLFIRSYARTRNRPR